MSRRCWHPTNCFLSAHSTWHNVFFHYACWSGILPPAFLSVSIPHCEFWWNLRYCDRSGPCMRQGWPLWRVSATSSEPVDPSLTVDWKGNRKAGEVSDRQVQINSYPHAPSLTIQSHLNFSPACRCPRTVSWYMQHNHKPCPLIHFGIQTWRYKYTVFRVPHNWARSSIGWISLIDIPYNGLVLGANMLDSRPVKKKTTNKHICHLWQPKSLKPLLMFWSFKCCLAKVEVRKLMCFDSLAARLRHWPEFQQ